MLRRVALMIGMVFVLFVLVGGSVFFNLAKGTAQPVYILPNQFAITSNLLSPSGNYTQWTFQMIGIQNETISRITVSLSANGVQYPANTTQSTLAGSQVLSATTIIHIPLPRNATTVVSTMVGNATITISVPPTIVVPG